MIHPIRLRATVGDLEMSLNGQVYDHDLTGELTLSVHPCSKFNDRVTPQLVIQDNVIPETPADALIDRPYFGSAPALYKLFDHPLFRRCAVPMCAIDPGETATTATLVDQRCTIIPAPAAALARMPADAPVERPWGVTRREREALLQIRV